MSVIVQTEVADALDRAEARGEKRVRVIAGLQPGSTVIALKDALQRLGVREYHRESDSFLALQLSREELLQVSQLTDHISRIWLGGRRRRLPLRRQHLLPTYHRGFRTGAAGYLEGQDQAHR